MPASPSAKKRATKRSTATCNDDGVRKRRTKNRNALANISNKGKQSREPCGKSAATSSRSHATKHKHLPSQKEDRSDTSRKRPCEIDRRHVQLVLDFISKEGHCEIPTKSECYQACRSLRNKQKKGELHEELLAKLNRTKMWFACGDDAKFARNASDLADLFEANGNFIIRSKGSFQPLYRFKLSLRKKHETNTMPARERSILKDFLGENFNKLFLPESKGAVARSSRQSNSSSSSNFDVGSRDKGYSSSTSADDSPGYASEQSDLHRGNNNQRHQWSSASIESSVSVASYGNESCHFSPTRSPTMSPSSAFDQDDDASASPASTITIESSKSIGDASSYHVAKSSQVLKSAAPPVQRTPLKTNFAAENASTASEQQKRFDKIGVYIRENEARAREVVELWSESRYSPLSKMYGDTLQQLAQRHKQLIKEQKKITCHDDYNIIVANKFTCRCCCYNS